MRPSEPVSRSLLLVASSSARVPSNADAFDKMVRSRLVSHSLNRAVNRPLSCHQNDGNGLRLLGKMAQQFEAAHARHFEIGDD